MLYRIEFEAEPEEIARAAKAFAEIAPHILQAIPPETQRMVIEAFTKAAFDAATAAMGQNLFSQMVKAWTPWPDLSKK